MLFLVDLIYLSYIRSYTSCELGRRPSSQTYISFVYKILKSYIEKVYKIASGWAGCVAAIGHESCVEGGKGVKKVGGARGEVRGSVGRSGEAREGRRANVLT